MSNETVDVPHLVAMERDQLLNFFRDLKSPSIAEMEGEFDGHLPRYLEEGWRAQKKSRGDDLWLGKGYRVEALDGNVGHGYNRYQGKDALVRRSRFIWNIDASSVDGAPSLLMKYGPFDNWPGQNDLIDEVRVVKPGLYFGIYHTAIPVPGFTSREGGNRSGLEVFFLTGPIGPAKTADHD